MNPLKNVPAQNTRNFSIIAHIDHGKSTLADRILELTHTVNEREMREQVLDRMDLERERGITIKAQAVRILYKARNGEEYVLNLIDTPGHVDFTYEVSRSLAACEGALLVVDAAQGVEAQTVANAHLAIENNLFLIPVINKIDLPNADSVRAKHEIEELGIDVENIMLVSAKTGQNVQEVLEAVIRLIPPPAGNASNPLKAMIFDSVFDPYRGAVVFTRVVDGIVKPRQKVKMMATSWVSEVEEVGIFKPDMVPTDQLEAGDVGYVIAGIKEIKNAKVGDTITDVKNPASEALSGYKEAKPMVFAGLYPIDGGEYENLREALDKLQLNDPALLYTPETSHALGFGFRCGFLGLLHMEIVRERLEREYQLELLTTTPSVVYRVIKRTGEVQVLNNPSDFPPPGEIEKIEEPYISAMVLVPPDYIGQVFELCQERRGEFKNMEYLSEGRVEIEHHLPLSEILLDFFNQLKSRTRGYASLDYEHIGYKESDLVKLDVLIAGQVVDALSCVVCKEKAHNRGRELVKRLRKIIPRQLFEVPIQAAIGSKIVARETVKAKKKDVLAKCYGGDITRKRKLLERQKAGKRKMKQIGKVDVPQEAFIAFLKLEEEKK